MRKQDGKTALQLILTIVILLLIAGVSVAMIFEGTDIASDIKTLIYGTEETNEKDDKVKTEE